MCCKLALGVCNAAGRKLRCPARRLRAMVPIRLRLPCLPWPCRCPKPQTPCLRISCSVFHRLHASLNCEAKCRAVLCRAVLCCAALPCALLLFSSSLSSTHRLSLQMPAHLPSLLQPAKQCSQQGRCFHRLAGTCQADAGRPQRAEGIEQPLDYQLTHLLLAHPLRCRNTTNPCWTR